MRASKLGLMTRAGQHIDSYKAVYAQAGSGLLLLFVTDIAKALLSADWIWVPFIILYILGAGLLYVYAVVEGGKRTTLVERLSAENENLAEALRDADVGFREHCSRRLLTIGEEAGFGGADRISLYKFDGKNFEMLGRSAEIPALSATGRGIYPANQGVIGIAWTSSVGKCFVDDLPDPVSDLDAYKQANEERFQFPRDLVDSITMRSRTIAAYVLKDMAGSTRSAIVLFESLDAKRFTDAELSAIVYGPAGRDLLLLMDALKSREPSLGLAKQKGF